MPLGAFGARGGRVLSVALAVTVISSTAAAPTASAAASAATLTTLTLRSVGARLVGLTRRAVDPIPEVVGRSRSLVKPCGCALIGAGSEVRAGRASRIATRTRLRAPLTAAIPRAPLLIPIARALTALATLATLHPLTALAALTPLGTIAIFGAVPPALGALAA